MILREMVLKFILKMEGVPIFKMMVDYGVLLRDSMNKKFIIEVCSDLDYEEMVADVSYENHTIATVTQENGIDAMEIEIFTPSGGMQSWKFLLNDFMEAITFAKNRLVEMKKLPEEKE